MKARGAKRLSALVSFSWITAFQQRDEGAVCVLYYSTLLPLQAHFLDGERYEWHHCL